MPGTKTPPRVLVLGATGKTGRRVVEALRSRGVDPAAASRRGPVRFDWTDHSTWPTAMRGVEAVYVVDSQDPEAAEEVRELADLAATSGVRRLVLLSSRTLGEMQTELATERAVTDSTIGWTILRPTWFAQNFTEFDVLAQPLRDDGVLRLPTGAGREAFVDLDDLGEVAAAALLDAGHDGRTYVLSGPRSLSFGDAVAEIARASGRDLHFVPVSEDAYRTELLAAHHPSTDVDELVAVLRHVRLERGWKPTNDILEALGRPPRDFSDYVVRTFAR